MKVIFAAYRDWAKEAVMRLATHPRLTFVKHASSLEELERKVADAHRFDPFDLVVLCGWSWQVSQDLLSKVTVVSEHPAERDEYSLGTPLQNQILDGIRTTKHRVVKIGYPELGERLYSPRHEVDMSLEGSMDDVLERMRDTSVQIYTGFLHDYPDVEWRQWPSSAFKRSPRVPCDSLITRHELAGMSLDQLYNKVRMLGGPYPRAFIEDEHGRLYFDSVRYVPKDGQGCASFT